MTVSEDPSSRTISDVASTGSDPAGPELSGHREGLAEEELIAWGEQIGRDASPPLVIALRGDLGAGKTTLARGIARGAGVTGVIPSPTYNLVNRYELESGVEVVHLDLYRIDNEDELWALGWSELPGEEDIVLIEWPENAESRLPVPRWEIRLAEASDSSRRNVELTRVGPTPSVDALARFAG